MNRDFDINAYDFELPPDRIAQTPADRRDASRLLLLDCQADTMSDRRFAAVADLFAAGDLLVVNDTRVFPARLQGRKETGGKAELLLLEFPRATGTTAAGRQRAAAVGLVRSSKRPRIGSRLLFSDALEARIEELLDDGKVRLTLSFRGDLAAVIESHGQVPLPPYIERSGGEQPQDRQRYQTVYARQTGAVAAPTAGLHFTPELIAAIEQKGVRTASVTLHVGYGTFAPVRVTDIRQHRIHAEYLTVSEATAEQVNRTKKEGGRVWAVGTTTVRALESAADERGHVTPQEGWCGLYIYPGYRFRVVDNLITNFHLPRSSLLFMVAALAGRERILASYRQAIERGYRFYSYGDAMAIVTRPATEQAAGNEVSS